MLWVAGNTLRFFCFVFFFSQERGFLCIALAVLDLPLDQVGLELTEKHLPLPPSTGIKGV